MKLLLRLVAGLMIISNLTVLNAMVLGASKVVSVGDWTRTQMRLQSRFILFVHDVLDCLAVLYPAEYAAVMKDSKQPMSAEFKSFLAKLHFTDAHGNITPQVKAAASIHKQPSGCCVVRWYNKFTAKALKELRIAGRQVLFEPVVLFIREVLAEVKTHGDEKVFKNYVDACNGKASLNQTAISLFAGYNLVEPNGTVAPIIAEVVKSLILLSTQNYAVQTLCEAQKKEKLLPAVTYLLPLSEESVRWWEAC